MQYSAANGNSVAEFTKQPKKLKKSHENGKNEEEKEVLDEKAKELDVDEFLEEVGGFGRYQCMIFLVFGTIFVPCAFQVLITMFISLNPGWRCSHNNKSSECNFATTVMKGDKNYDLRCSMQRSSWEFTEPKSYSIVTEWDLVCGKKTLSYLASSTLFIGWAIGAIFLGILADRKGRKTVLFPSFVLLLLFGFLSGIVENFWLFFILRLTVGFCMGGCVITVWVIASEINGPKHRSYVSALWFFSTGGFCLLALQAKYITNWRMLAIVLSAPYILLVVTYKFVPESIRWLRLNNRTEDAEQILRTIARINRARFPKNAKLSKVKVEVTSTSYKDLFTPRSVAVKTLLQSLLWFVNGLAFYGIALAADNLGGDFYRDFVLLSLINVPSNIVAIWVNNRFGRKASSLWGMLATAICCAIVAATYDTGLVWVRLLFGIISKFTIGVGFSSIYVWSTEIFPTNIRSQGMSFMTIVSRCGAAVSPWVAQFLHHLHAALPFGAIGALALISTATGLLLKETKGVATPETSVDILQDGDLKKDEVNLLSVVES